MNIIDLKNIFVPEHIAYLLRSIGFNFKCLLRQSVLNNDKFTYVTFKEEQEIGYDIENNVLIEDLKLIRNSELPKDNISLDKTHKTFVTIPTYEQVLKWFRNKNIIGWVECQCNPEMEYFTRTIINGVNYYIKGKRKSYKTYEDYSDRKSVV